jgi:predicted HAD superfamily Cof-like phosphohydrolase
MVREFHEVFRLDHPDHPTPLPAERAMARQRILDEEVGELADVVYVAYGTAISYGIDLDAVITEVHRANMTKLGADGQPVIRDGKVQKGDRFQPPDVAAVLRRRGPGPDQR